MAFKKGGGSRPVNADALKETYEDPFADMVIATEPAL